MTGSSGKFIVIDGTDGSGKTTQLGLLKSRLEEAGYSVAVADFPQYNTKSAGLVEEYLSGKYGQADEVDSYKSSIFYAVDRYDASFKIREWLREGKIVLANRYTSANMGHQGCKIANPLERKVFFNWLYDLEYKIFSIPRPDLTLILHVEAEAAQKMAKDRARADWNGKSKDIHEDNLDHLKKAEQVYLEIAQSFPGFQLIRCTKDGQVLERSEISLLVWPAVNRIIKGSGAVKGFRPIGDIIGTNRQIISNREMIFEKAKATEPAGPAAPTAAATVTAPIIPEATGAPKRKENLILKIEKIHPQAKILQKAHEGDAAYDLYSCDYYSIPPYGQDLISTGLKLKIPQGHVGLIWDKSGLAASGLTTMGGVIDANYRGEIKVVFKNLSEDHFNIVPGQKVAQLLIQALPEIEIIEENIVDLTDRAAAGFGSTGHF